jgi:tetratricopeptide (TPR) repeat protein
MASTITAILTKPPPNLAELRPDAPYPLVDLINRILEKDRDKRNISARQVGAELEAILHGETTPAQPVKSRFYTPVPTPPPTSALPSSTSIIHTPTGRVAGEELDGSTELGMKPVTATFSPTAPPSKLPLIMGSIVTILVIAAGVFFFAARRAAVPIVPTAIIKTVSTPAAKDEYVVLVAPLQAVRAQERDSSRLIVSDLKQRLEVEAPFSKIRIRQYATVIASHDEAQAAAQAEGATLVVWGTYDENGLQLNLQIGDISAFKYNSFNRDLLERTTNVRITITDESRQSIAPQVLGAIGVLAIADGDVYEFGRMLAIMDTLKVSGAEVTGDSVAARVQRYFGAYLHNTNDAFTAADQAITSDSSNAILYALRSQARWQILAQTGGSPGVTEVDNADRDARTAQRLASEQWALPYILFRSSAYASYRASLYDQNLANLSKMIELRPDDWYLRLSRGIVYYQIKQYDQAEKDIDDGIALKPDTSFPYSFAVVLSLRKGNLQQAADLTDTIVRDLPPDPAFFTRLEKALFGDNTGLGGSMFPVFSRLILDQYNDAIQMVQNSAKDGSLPQGTILIDVNMMQGVAQCNLGRYDKAVNLYNLFIPTNSDYPLLLLLRADSLLAQNKNDLGRKDIAKLMQSKNADTFAPFAMAVMNSEFGCKDLFDKRKIATVQAKYGATKAAAINGMLTGQAPTPKPEGTASQ